IIFKCIITFKSIVITKSMRPVLPNLIDFCILKRLCTFFRLQVHFEKVRNTGYACGGQHFNSVAESASELYMFCLQMSRLNFRLA
ncbi:MAG: hypothetical protein ACE3JU_25415, partial [Paenibacillus sp.]|uniref:hypothetical protein n=1 Tax=Paenibacillus sp. TaxID=58172 RepID=UPI003B76D2FF